MTLHLECGKAGHGGQGGVTMPVEVGSLLKWSESIATANVSAEASPDDHCVFTLTATADGYAAFGSTVTTTSANAHPRRRILAGQRVSFAALKGDKVAWTEG